MINIPLFLFIGLAGLIITVIVYFTGKDKKYKTQEESNFGYVSFLKISVSIILIVYLFRLIMMVLTGLISGLHMPVVVGGIFALIPLALIGLTSIKTTRSKV